MASFVSVNISEKAARHTYDWQGNIKWLSDTHINLPIVIIMEILNTQYYFFIKLIN